MAYRMDVLKGNGETQGWYGERLTTFIMRREEAKKEPSGDREVWEAILIRKEAMSCLYS